MKFIHPLRGVAWRNYARTFSGVIHLNMDVMAESQKNPGMLQDTMEACAPKSASRGTNGPTISNTQGDVIVNSNLTNKTLVTNSKLNRYTNW